jgi:DNA-binding transcriptional MerR regulator
MRSHKKLYQGGKVGPTEEEKLYYSISEVGKITGIKPYVLRFWEKEFPNLRPKKNRAGNRSYQKKDIDLVNTIKYLLYQEGYTIEGARDKLKGLKKKKGSESTKDKAKFKAILFDIRRELEEMLRLF